VERPMGRYLVVANQTLGGDQLMNEIRQRIASGPSSFHVLVPLTRPPQGGYLGALATEAPAALPKAPDDTAWHRALLASQARLDQLIGQIRAEGGDARGDIGDPDPVKAIDSLISREGRFDEIIVSTLPTGASRWLRMDLPHQVERKYKLPVTTVTGKRAR
jgi:hypothetical protein